MNQSQSNDLCELHKQQLTFVCRSPKCLGGYYAFGCQDCLQQSGLHRHAHQAKHRQALSQYLKDIDDFFSQDPTILELIDQTKAILFAIKKENKFFKENYPRLMDTLRIRSINRLPKDQQLEILLNFKERRISKIKQDCLVKIANIRNFLAKKEKTVTAKKINDLRDLVTKIVRKFRINYERSNPDLLDILSVSNELKELQTNPQERAKSPTKQPPKFTIKTAGSCKQILQVFSQYQPLSVRTLDLQIDFDFNLQLRTQSYKALLGIIINEFYNVTLISFTIADAFITPQKIALLKDFLIEMSTKGNLKQFILMNREAISGVSMPALQADIKKQLPEAFELRAQYFYS